MPRTPTKMPAATKTTKHRQQQEFDERAVDDPELEAALNEMFENKQAAADYAAAAKLVKRRAVEQHNLKPDEVLRCGEYVIPGVHRQGGDFRVPKWEKNGVGRIASDVDDVTIEE